MINPLLQRPLRMRHRLGTTSKFHPRTNIIPPFFTPFACFARQANFKRDFIPNREVRDRGADGDYHAGGFVA